MPSPGRPSKLTPQVQTLICKAIRAGMPYREACLLAGISERTFMKWRKYGRTHKKGRYFELAQAVELANAEVMQDMTGIILEAATRGTEVVEVSEVKDGAGNLLSERTSRSKSPRDWRAALTFLEKRFPSTYGRSAVEHSFEGAAPAGGSGVTLNLVFDDGESDKDRIREVDAVPDNPNADIDDIAKEAQSQSNSMK